MPIPTEFTLNTGAKMPAVGFGTWQAPEEESARVVELALKCGYRLIDGAAIYRNEKGVGAGIKASGVPRDQIFVTSKLWNSKHAPEDVEPALNKTLSDLGLDYVDLYLMHWPCAFRGTDNKFFPLRPDGVFDVVDIDPAETYKAMEKLLATGKVKAIGVCNFNQKRLEDMMSKTTIVPAVLQNEAHPWLQQNDLKAFCDANGIVSQAYSSLGNNLAGLPRIVDDAKVQELAKEAGIEAGIMLYSWAVQRGTSVLPKSVTPSRVESNRQVKELPQPLFDALNAMERHGRLHYQKHWGTDIFQELSEEEVQQCAKAAGPSNLQKFTV